MPFSFGMPMSRMRRSGWCVSRRRIASRPSVASATTDSPAPSSRLLRPRRTMPWSSASSTRKRRLLHHFRHRQLDRERCAFARGPGNGHGATELLDPLLDAAKPQPLSTVPWIEADAIVDHGHLQSIEAVDAHLDRACASVTDAVGERLLNDAVHTGAILIRQGGEVALRLQLDVEPIAAGQVA